jgi:hypothetical protein
MATILIYNTSGAIQTAYTFSNDMNTAQVAASNTPPGMSYLIVPDGHPAVYQPTQWSVKSGALIQTVQT